MTLSRHGVKCSVFEDKFCLVDTAAIRCGAARFESSVCGVIALKEAHIYLECVGVPGAEMYEHIITGGNEPVS